MAAKEYSGEQLEVMASYAQALAANAAQKIYGGNIQKQHAKGECDYCDYCAVCMHPGENEQPEAPKEDLIESMRRKI